MSIPWELLTVGVDAAVVLLLYKLYKNGTKSADLVKEAERYEIGPSLKEALDKSGDGCIAYGCVEGSVESLGKPFRSKYSEEDMGVIQQLMYIEHKSKRTQGYWSDYKRIIKDNMNITPFRLSNNASTEHTVEVLEPTAADFLMDDLKVTYDQFEPAKAGLIEKGLDRIFGDVTKGFQETEKMLTVGMPLLGIGRISWDGKKISIEPPIEGQQYILTSWTKSEVIKKLQSQAKVYKVLALIFGAVGLGVFSYWLYKQYRVWRSQREMETLMNQINARRSEGELEEAITDNTNCVVCLANPRQVVLLECGHICLCAECADALPSPKVCPICRAGVKRVVATYVS